MEADRLIPEEALAQLWRVHPITVYQWWRDGRLVADKQVPVPYRHGFNRHYRLGTIDRFHAACATGFGPHILPSTADLLRTGLLTITEAAQCLGKTDGQVRYAISRGFIPAFHILQQHVIRLPAALIDVIASSQDGFVTQATALKVLCLLQMHSLRRLMQEYPLERVGQSKHGWFVSRESLLGLLPSLLTSPISPEEWWQRCVADPRRPLAKQTIARLHRIGINTVNAEIAAGRLLGIRTGGGQTKVPQWALDRFLRIRQALPVQQLTVLFAADTATVMEWVRKKALCNLRHGMPYSDAAHVVCPSLRCVASYIMQHRTSEMVDPQEWLTLCLKNGVGTISSDELLRTTNNTDEGAIKQALASGTLRGVWLPPVHGGTRQAAIIRVDARLYQHKQERALRRKP